MDKTDLVIILLSAITFFLAVLTISILFGPDAVVKTVRKLVKVLLIGIALAALGGVLYLLNLKFGIAFIIGFTNLLFAVLGIVNLIQRARERAVDFRGHISDRLGMGIILSGIGLPLMFDLQSIGMGIALFCMGAGRLYSIWASREEWKLPKPVVEQVEEVIKDSVGNVEK